MLGALCWLLELETSVSPNPDTRQGHQSNSRAEHLCVNQGPVGQVRSPRICEQVPDGQRCNISTQGIHKCACACDWRVVDVCVCVRTHALTCTSDLQSKARHSWLSALVFV